MAAPTHGIALGLNQGAPLRLFASLADCIAHAQDNSDRFYTMTAIFEVRWEAGWNGKRGRYVTSTWPKIPSHAAWLRAGNRTPAGGA